MIKTICKRYIPNYKPGKSVPKKQYISEGKLLNIMVLIAYFSSISFFLPCISSGQSFGAGSKESGMANSSLLLESVWASRNQPAALGIMDKFSAGIWAERRFGLKELTTGALSLVIPFNKGKGGALGFASYLDGATTYLTTYVNTLAYGLKLTEGLYAGAGLHLIRFRSIEPYGTVSAFSGDIGLIYKKEGTGLGLNISNPFPAKVPGTQENLASTYRVGVRQELNKVVWLSGELFHEVNVGSGIKAAAHYKPSKSLAIYTGFRSLPATYSFGVSLFAKNIDVDLSFAVYNRLGNTPGISIEYGERMEN